MAIIKKSIESAKLSFPAFEPKTHARFVVKMKEFPSWAIFSVTRPSAYYSIAPRNAGWNWEPIQIMMYDPIVPNLSKVVYELMQRKQEPTLEDITIEILGPVNDVVESWKLHGCKIETVDFGIFDWRAGSTDEQGETKPGDKERHVANITLMIMYDSVTYNSEF